MHPIIFLYIKLLIQIQMIRSTILLPPILEEVRESASAELLTALQYYQDDLDLLLHLRWLSFSPATVYDIGASNSIWSALASGVYPQARFELFEPLKNISEDYKTTCAKHPAIKRFYQTSPHAIHEVALGPRNGECTFTRFAHDSGSTSLAMDPNHPGISQITVPMRRLDDYVHSNGLAKPDLMKLDTQGSEMEIFTGADECLRFCQVIFLEAWLIKSYGPATPLLLEMANFLAAYDFVLFSLGDEYRFSETTLHTKDVVFIKRTLRLDPQPPIAFPEVPL
jgi:FkbM family methyltransferase